MLLTKEIVSKMVLFCKQIPQIFCSVDYDKITPNMRNIISQHILILISKYYKLYIYIYIYIHVPHNDFIFYLKILPFEIL